MHKDKYCWYVDNKVIASSVLIWIAVVFASTLPACSPIPLQAPAPAPVAASSTATSNVAQAETIEEIVTTNETINETTNQTNIQDGLDPWWWILIGLLLPMPKFMRVIF